MSWKMTGRLALVGAAAAALAGCASMQQSVSSLNPSVCHRTTVTLYFESSDDQVGDIGKQIIDLNAKRLATCHVRELRLVGLADPAGAPQANLDLSKRRAENVLAAFRASGLPVEKYTLIARGDTGAVTAEGAVAPLRRRVIVTVMASRH